MANHVSENGDPLFRPYLTVSLKLPYHFSISIFIEFPYENFLLFVVSHVLLRWLAKRRKVNLRWERKYFQRYESFLNGLAATKLRFLYTGKLVIILLLLFSGESDRGGGDEYLIYFYFPVNFRYKIKSWQWFWVFLI